MINEYCLCFEKSTFLDEVEEIFSAKDFSVTVNQVLPTCFSLLSELSFSDIKKSLDLYYTKANPDKSCAVMKIKGNSKIFIVQQPSN